MSAGGGHQLDRLTRVMREQPCNPSSWIRLGCLYLERAELGKALDQVILAEQRACMNEDRHLLSDIHMVKAFLFDRLRSETMPESYRVDASRGASPASGGGELDVQGR